MLDDAKTLLDPKKTMGDWAEVDQNDKCLEEDSCQKWLISSAQMLTVNKY